MAPVNPEGQTARDLTDEEIANGEQWIAALTTGPVRYPEMKIDCSLLARLLAEVKRRRAVRPSEGQTAQEVRRAANEGRQSAYVHMQALVSSCLRAAEEEARALAHPEPKAETPAEKQATAGQLSTDKAMLAEALRQFAPETAGQKEGRTTCRATVDFDPLEMCEPIECGNPMPCALHPAQPSQDVAGTSGESLAGLSKEGSETP